MLTPSWASLHGKPSVDCTTASNSTAHTSCHPAATPWTRPCSQLAWRELPASSRLTSSRHDSIDRPVTGIPRLSCCSLSRLRSGHHHRAEASPLPQTCEMVRRSSTVDGRARWAENATADSNADFQWERSGRWGAVKRLSAEVFSERLPPEGTSSSRTCSCQVAAQSPERSQASTNAATGSRVAVSQQRHVVGEWRAWTSRSWWDVSAECQNLWWVITGRNEQHRVFVVAAAPTEKVRLAPLSSRARHAPAPSTGPRQETGFWDSIDLTAMPQHVLRASRGTVSSSRDHQGAYHVRAFRAHWSTTSRATFWLCVSEIYAEVLRNYQALDLMWQLL